MIGESNRMLITEKQYLDRMRALYEKYFRGLSQYQDKYNEEQQKYLQGMLSLYNSAISAVGSIIDRRIKGLNKERDAIIKGYEDQKDAIQKVIDAKQEQIDGIQDEIDAIQKEIDAINEANEARQRQLTLQQDLYNMERLMAQRTRLVYKDGQMVYQNDTRELRDAREKVYQDQLQEEIAAKEKQIQQKQEEIELIEKAIEALEKQQDAIDKMIEDTNEYFDKLIEALEDYKDRWQELAELEEQAKIMGILEELGYSTDDILNMSEDAFQAFKGEYLGILKDMNSGNDEFLNQLGKLADVNLSDLPGYLEKTADAVNSMDAGNLDDLKNGLKEVDSALGGTGGSSPATGTSSGASSGGGTGIAGKAKDASLALDEMAKTDTTAISTGLDNLYKTCQNLDLILGKEGNFVEKLLSLGSGEVSLQGLIDQFILLNDAISQVATAIGVGSGTGQATDEAHSFSPNYTGDEGNGEGLLSALEQVNSSDLSTITNAFAGEDDEDNSSLLSAVNKVTDAVGSEGGENEQALVPTIVRMPDETKTPMEDLYKQFEKLQEIILSCAKAVGDLKNAITSLKVPNMSGGSEEWTGTAYASGTAYSKGNWSARSKGHKGGKALVGELGREIVVSNNGKWRTVGNNGAEFINLKPSDIVFNHVQSAQLLGKGKTNGQAYASGNLPEGFAPLSELENSRFDILSEVKDLAVRLDLGNKTLDAIDRSVEKITTNNTVNNNPVINVNNPSFTCTGITSADVLEEIQMQFSGILSKAYQQSMAQ